MALSRWRQQDPEKQTRYLYYWLLLALVFEYTRPGVFFAPLAVIPLVSIIPLTLLVATFFAKGLRPWRDVMRDPMAKWVTVYIVAIVASMAWSENQTRGLHTFNTALGYFFLFVMIVRIATTEQRVIGVFATLILCHIFLVFMNTQLIFDPSIRHYVKGAPFMGDGNDYSLSVCLLVPAIVYVALRAPSRFKQLMWWLAFILLILAVVGTQSRGATLGIGAVFGYMWLRSGRKALALFAIAIVGGIAALFAPAVYFERMGTIASYQEESSAQSRIEAWKAGTKMALKNPLGVGSGNFPNNFSKYKGPNAPTRWMTAHSMYFLILGELGFLGLVLLIHLVFGNVRLHSRLRKALEEKPDIPNAALYERTLYMLSASFVGFGVAGAFLSVAYYPHIFVLNGLALAYRAVVVEKTGIAMVAPKKAPRSRAGRMVQPAAETGRQLRVRT
jgi:putative inorganic carbon (hco3(-)) transporter